MSEFVPRDATAGTEGLEDVEQPLLVLPRPVTLHAVEAPVVAVQEVDLLHDVLTTSHTFLCVLLLYSGFVVTPTHCLLIS